MAYEMLAWLATAWALSLIAVYLIATAVERRQWRRTMRHELPQVQHHRELVDDTDRGGQGSSPLLVDSDAVLKATDTDTAP